MAAQIRIDRTLSERDVARTWVAVLEGVTKLSMPPQDCYSCYHARQGLKGERVDLLRTLWRD